MNELNPHKTFTNLDSMMFGEILVEREDVGDGCCCEIFVMTFKAGWSVADYKDAAVVMYDYMDTVKPKDIFVVADFSDPGLSFRRDIIGPVVIDRQILQLSVEGPENRKGIYFVFTNQRLLSFAKFSASAYQKFIDDLMKPQYIVHSVQEARDKVAKQCAD